MKAYCLFAVSLIMVLISTAVNGRACESLSADGEEFAFPLRVSANRRYLVDADGKPFFMNGDTPWSLIAELSRQEAELYLRDRKARGFNTILVNLIEHKFATNAPENIYGERPFIIHSDFTSVNERYFEHADWILQKACDLGFVVLLAPAYLGYGGGDDGWYADMRQSGTEKLRSYGRFVGERYAHLDNIIWTHGGDYDPPDKDLVRAIAEGIVQADSDALHTAHGAPETDAVEYWEDEPWLTINNIYTKSVLAHARKQYARADVMPFFLIESIYEYEHSADEQQIRMQAYHAILGGAFGHLFGNNPIWHFSGPGLFPPPMGWKEALDSPGARSMSVLWDVFSSLSWWLLEPDADGELIVRQTAGDKESSVAAYASDGSFGLVYLEAAKPITLDLSVFTGQKVDARWIDPSTGDKFVVANAPLDASRQILTPPSANHGGFTDWVLELIAVNGPQRSR